jgi:hypothetical protein
MVAAFIVSLSSGLALASNQSIAEKCALGGPCADLVVAQIRTFNGTTKQVDDKIADLVIALGERAQELTPNLRETMADGVDMAALYMSNTEQQKRVKAIAKALRRKLEVNTQAVGDDGQQASGN